MSSNADSQIPVDYTREEMVRQSLVNHELDVVSNNASKLKSDSPLQMPRCPSFFDNILNQVQESTKNKNTTSTAISSPNSKTPENEGSPYQSDDSDSEKGNDSPKEKRGGRRKIDIKFINNKSRRHVTFSKRKAGLIKKAYELSTLTGTQVLLLVASETGNVYTFATPKLQPLINQEEGKTLIQQCLNSDPVPVADTPQQIPEPHTIPQPQNHQKLDVQSPRVRGSYLLRDTSIGSFAKSLMREQLSVPPVMETTINNIPKQNNTVLNQFFKDDRIQQKAPTALTQEMLAVASSLPGVNYANLNMLFAQHQNQVNFANSQAQRQTPQLVTTGSYTDMLKGQNFLDLP